jgi:hypothetical protein
VTLKDFADLATSLTLIVAALTFVYTLLERNSRERRKELQDWQKVVVYQIVDEGTGDFDQIRVHYVIAAQQFPDFKIPKKDIQDGALRLLLLSLMESRLISITEDGQYIVNRVSLAENIMRSAAISQMQKKLAENKLLSQLFLTLDHDSGKYGVDQLYRVLKASEDGFAFEDFDALVRDFINRGAIVLSKEGKLFARNRAPTPPAR